MRFKSLLLTSMMVALLASCNKDNEEVTVKLGAILDLSGNNSDDGNSAKAAIELSLDEINGLYEEVGSPVRFTCEFEDTGMDTIAAMNAAEGMYNKGIRILVAGPSTSAELKAVQSFVNENKMLVLNCFSTAPSLAVWNDYIFRILPDDNGQAQALIRMMQLDSIRVVVPVWTDDTYGKGLYDAVRQRLQNAGGVMLPGINYKPGATNFAEIMSMADTRVKEVIDLYGISSVGVILISYQESAGLMEAAADQTYLSGVKWYGCDANVGKSGLLANRKASGFAAAVRFKGPIMGIGTATAVPEMAAKIMDQVKGITGFTPRFYCVNAFDAVKIISQAYNIVRSYDTQLIKEILPSVCEAYNYAGISRKLNEAGDLKTANYIFYTIYIKQSGSYWDTYATYMAEGDFILLK